MCAIEADGTQKNIDVRQSDSIGMALPLFNDILSLA